MMASWPARLVLMGLALVLSGCGGGGGGGGGKKPNDSPAVLTSQSVSGNLNVHSTAMNMSIDLPSQITFHFDADALNVNVCGVVSYPSLNISSRNFTVIMNATAKRATLYMPAVLPKPLPPVSGCVYKELESLPPVELMKSLLKSAMESRKPDGMDGDYRQWYMKEAPNPGASVEVRIDLDDDNGFRKATGSVTANATGAGSQHGDLAFTATDVKIGKPDAGLFTVPKEWGKCIAAPSDPPLSMLLAASLLEYVSGLAGALAVPSTSPKAEAVVVV